MPELVHPLLDLCNIIVVNSAAAVCTDGDLIDKPKKAWGAKTCTLNGGMLSIPIENHKNYLAKWNHYLFAKAGENGEEPSVPDWWETATDTVMTAAMRRNYAWGSAYSDAPATEGETWTCIGEPSKPGVNSYDVGTYQITEVARFRSMEAAGKMIQNLLNTICMPAYTFGITGGDWKCDGASVSYNGKYWLATLTYTRSGDEGGWDDDLYAETKGAL